jgi:signal transduction histidine kinase
VTLTPEQALAQVEQARARLAFLADAGALVGSSLNYDVTLGRVAKMAVPFLADWCRVYMIAEDGSVRRVAAAFADREKEKVARALQDYAPSPTSPNSAVAHALATGEAQLSSEIPDEYVAQIAQSEEHLALMRQLGFRSSMVVPLRARGRVLGAIAFFTAESGRRYGPEDLRFAEEVAQRAALAVDNARLYQELEEAVQLRNHFLAAAAHDLKTPLTAIKVSAQLLGRHAERVGGPISERMREGLDRIDANTARMVRLIDELLDVASLQVGQPLRLDAEEMDLAELVETMVEELRPTVPRHTLRAEVPAEGVVGTWDPVRLERVLSNLLSNAIKYSPAGGEVVVAVERDGSAALLRVSDQGIGIPTADLQRVFERFHRGTNVEDRIAGSGIGLSGVRQIVHQHGGTIEVESEEGVGSIFTIRLPLGPTES